MSFPAWTTCLSFYQWVFIAATSYPALAYCCPLTDVRGKNSVPCCLSSVLTSKLEFSSLVEQSLTSWAISGWTRTEPSLILLGDLGRLMKPSWASRFGSIWAHYFIWWLDHDCKGTMPALLWVHHFMMATKFPEYARPCLLTPSLVWDGLKSSSPLVFGLGGSK